MASPLRFTSLALLAASLLLTLGCEGWMNPFERFKAKRAFHGEVSLALPYTPLSLDPLGAEYLQQEGLLKQLFPTLLRSVEGPDGRVTYEPGLASEWEISPDGLSVVMTLDDEALWNDATPMSAEDVVTTLRLQQDPSLPFPLKGLKSVIVTAQALGEHEVRFELSAPVVDPLKVINSGVIIPAHAMADRSAESTPPYLGVTGGPFEVRGGRRIFQAGRKRFEASLPMVLVPDLRCEARICPKLREVKLSYHASMPDRIGLLFQGDNDYLPGVPLSALDDIAARSELRLTFGGESTLSILSWNVAHPTLSSPKVRQALGKAFSRQGVVAGPLRGVGRIWAPDTLDGESGSGGSVGSGLGIGADPATVSGLLREAGLVDEDEDGWLELGEGPLVVELLYDESSSTQEEMAELLREDLRRVGVQTLLRGLAVDSLLRRGESGNFQAILMDWSMEGAGTIPGVGWVATHFGEGLEGVEAALRALKSAPSDEGLKAASAQILSGLEAEAPLAVIAERRRLDASSRRLLGIQGWATAYADLHLWHLEAQPSVESP